MFTIELLALQQSHLLLLPVFHSFVTFIGCQQQFRILFKIALLTYKTLYEKQPVYLHSVLAAPLLSRSMRSRKGINVSIPRVETNTGARAFHSHAPPLWNILPLSVFSAISVATLKKHLKTHLFDLALPR